MKTIRIFDTTLRDGEQSPGASLDPSEKLEIARQLEVMGVDVIEAGFAASSDTDFRSILAISNEIKSSTVCSLARSTSRDIELAGRAVQGALRSRIHVFCGTSPLHREFKLRKGKQEIIDLVAWSVKEALKYVPDVEWSAEDATRTEEEFLVEAVRAAIEAGASTINLPDTVGYATPKAYRGMFSRVRADLRQLIEDNQVALSAHCHDDLGLAVANTLAAIECGATQVECTVNGIGERAGNASLEEIVMALRTRRDFYGVETSIDARKLYPVSRIVSTLTGLDVQRNKAIVGENAFSHEAGIHQDGYLKHRGTYEIIDPRDVGIPEASLVLGRHSGRHALKKKIEEMGFKLSDAEFESLFERFKSLAGKKKEVFDEDVLALVEEALGRVSAVWALVDLKVETETGELPKATVVLEKDSRKSRPLTALGDGPIDAIFSAIQVSTGVSAKLLRYSTRSVTEGSSAQGEAQVELSCEGKRYRGRGFSTDVLEASAHAFLSALNRCVRSQS